MDNLDTSYDEFFGAFEGADGNQTETEDTAEETVTAEDGEDSAEEVSTEPEDGESAGEVTDEDAEEDATEDGKEPPKENPAQKFTIKVNKETREIGLSEMTELAQKGADYDRVKGQLDTSRQNEQALQAKIDEQKPFMDFLEAAAEQTKKPMKDLVHDLHKNLLMTSKGMSEAEAESEIRAVIAEKQVKDLTDQNSKQGKEEPAEDGLDRAQQEIAEFAKTFPDVQITDDLLEKLMPDVHAGMSLTSAYLKQENAKLLAQIDAEKQKQAAAKQNQKNRSKTPGSQRDSGGQNTRDAFDGFFDAFEK